MITQNIALVDRTGTIDPAVLAQTAAALQKQATRDLGPIWDIDATVADFPDVNSVPVGYWPIFIMQQLDDPNAEGYHQDDNNQPYSMVVMDDSWQLTCSHEMCEMLVDSSGNRTVTSGSKDPNQGRVQYLVEVCDPCEDPSFGYTVNGILLSDFYTPNYFDPVAASGVRYSFTGSITEPLQVNKNGYLSWLNPDDGQWYQATFFGTSLQIAPIQGMNKVSGALRSRMDRLTKNPNKVKVFQKSAKALASKLNKGFASSKSAGSSWDKELLKHWKGK